MEKNKSIFILPFTLCCTLFLVLDSKTAFIGASEGINLCLNSVIPSLFPFFFFSTMLTSLLQNKTPQNNRKTHLHIPENCLPLLFLGFLSGYPVGAKNVQQAYLEKRISKENAEKLLAPCNNAGPAFIFGILSHMFQNKAVLWSLWGTQIVSALIITAFLSIKQNNMNLETMHAKEITATQALKTAINAIASVCGWIILFKSFLCILQNRLFFSLPKEFYICLTGFLELTNGCFVLSSIISEPVRYLLCTAYLGFGGLCVILQTASVAAPLSMKRYMKTKIFHCILSVILAYISLPFLYTKSAGSFYSLRTSYILIVIFIFLPLICKKTVAFLKNMLYNEEKLDMRGLPYDF